MSCGRIVKKNQKSDRFRSQETSTHNDAHDPPAMSSVATLGAETRARKRKRGRRDANPAIAGEAFPGLPNHVVVEHILRSEHFDDFPQFSHGSQR